MEARTLSTAPFLSQDSEDLPKKRALGNRVNQIFQTFTDHPTHWIHHIGVEKAVEKQLDGEQRWIISALFPSPTRGRKKERKKGRGMEESTAREGQRVTTSAAGVAERENEGGEKCSLSLSLLSSPLRSLITFSCHG